MTTTLYMLAGWMLLNVLFAAGMYFRPVRKAAPDGCVPDADSSTLRETSNIRAIVRAGSGMEPVRYPASRLPPALVGKVLFFGLWLGDCRHPV